MRGRVGDPEKPCLSAFLKVRLGIFSRNLEKRVQFSGSDRKTTLAPPPAAHPGRCRALGKDIFQADPKKRPLFSRFPENMPSPIFRNALKQGFPGSHYFLRDASYQHMLVLPYVSKARCHQVLNAKKYASWHLSDSVDGSRNLHRISQGHLMHFARTPTHPGT